MLSLDLEWLAPVSLLRSDRWLNFYMQPHGPQDPKALRQLGAAAIADLQYYQAQAHRTEDREAALQRCFDAGRTDCHNLEFIRHMGNQLLCWRGNAFEVRHSHLALWSALIAKLDPAWLIAGAYAALIEHGTLTPQQMAALGATQCPSAFPSNHGGAEFADNHVHLNGHGGHGLSLLNFSVYLAKSKTHAKVDWPPQPEFPLYASGTREIKELPSLVNRLYHYLALTQFSLLAVEDSSHVGYPEWRAPATWKPVGTGSVTKMTLRGAHTPAQQLMLAAVRPDIPHDHQWLLLCTSLLLHDRQPGISQQQRYGLRAYIHACNILRASMVMAGVGLGEFVQYFGFAHRKPRIEDVAGHKIDAVQTYAQYALSTDSAAHVLREIKVGPDKVEIKQLRKAALELLAQGRQDRCQYAFHFSRNGYETQRSDRLQRNMRRDLRHKTRKILQVLSSVEAQHATLATTPPQTVNLTHLIRGIDVAGNENMLPIEVFAPAIRVLRAGRASNASLLFQPGRQMHLTIHAGEDYSHLVSGLRAIDETVRFCDYQHGDRLGHALALGVDAQTWLERQGRIYLPLQEYVDNLVWCHGMALDVIQHAPRFHGVIHILEQKIFRWAPQLYESQRQVNIADLHRAWELRRNCPQISRLTSHAYGSEWELWVPDMRYLNDNPDSQARTLWQHYLRPATPNADTQAKGMMSLAIGERHSLDVGHTSHCSEVLSPLELEFITAIQDLLIERYSRAGIIIEACPTSNIYIGRFNDYHEHPIYRWYPPCASALALGGVANRYGLRNGPIKVCVNTDDAGIMPTTIEHEHRLLKGAAISHHGVSGDSAELWIDRIRRIGVEEFRKNHIDWS